MKKKRARVETSTDQKHKKSIEKKQENPKRGIFFHPSKKKKSPSIVVLNISSQSLCWNGWKNDFYSLFSGSVEICCFPMVCDDVPIYKW